MNKTKIDWATMSWNPVTGCRHGCPYCYARRTATRFNAGLEDPAPLAGRGSNDVGRVHVQVQCGSRTVHGFAAHTDTTRASIEAFLDALRVLNVTERKEKEE